MGQAVISSASTAARFGLQEPSSIAACMLPSLLKCAPVLLCLTLGCSATRRWDIDSVPQGYRVSVDGVAIGPTPCWIEYQFDPRNPYVSFLVTVYPPQGMLGALPWTQRVYPARAADNILVATFERTSSPLAPPRALQLADLEGTRIIADDRTFLGIITKDPLLPDSITNRFGEHSSSIFPDSIFCRVGLYGSPASHWSAFNPYAISPPYIVDDGGHWIAYLSTNPQISPRVDTHALLAFLGISQ